MKWGSIFLAFAVFALAFALSFSAISGAVHAQSLQDIINSIISILTGQNPSASTQGLIGDREPCTQTCPDGTEISCGLTCPTKTTTISTIICAQVMPPYCPQGTLIKSGGVDQRGCPLPPTCCGNGLCEYGENYSNCPKDCITTTSTSTISTSTSTTSACPGVTCPLLCGTCPPGYQGGGCYYLNTSSCTCVPPRGCFPINTTNYYLCTYANPNNIGGGFYLNNILYRDGQLAPIEPNIQYTITAASLTNSSLLPYVFSYWSAARGVSVSNYYAANTIATFDSSGWDGTCVGNLAANYQLSSVTTTSPPPTDKVISLLDTTCDLNNVISAIVKNVGTASLSTTDIKFYVYPLSPSGTQTTTATVTKPTAPCFYNGTIPTQGCVLPTSCDRLTLYPQDTTTCKVSGYYGLNTLLIAGPSNTLRAQIYCTGGTNCQSGTVTATAGLSVGTYTIYSDLASANTWARIVIKNSAGSTVDTAVINQLDMRDFTTSDITVRVDKVAAYQNGTVVGVQIAATTPIGAINCQKPPCPYQCCNQDDPIYAYKPCLSACSQICIPSTFGTGGCVTPPCMTSVCQNHQCLPQNPTYTINFKAGWNLFSVPVQYVQSSTTSCSPASPIFGLSNGGYYETSYTSGGYGYWVKMNSDCQVVVSGTNVTTGNLPYLTQGWNLIGAPSSSVSISDILGTCTVLKGPLYYDQTIGNYIYSSTLDPGKGYFIKVSDSCKLGTGLPPPPPQ